MNAGGAREDKGRMLRSRARPVLAPMGRGKPLTAYDKRTAGPEGVGLACAIQECPLHRNTTVLGPVMSASSSLQAQLRTT